MSKENPISHYDFDGLAPFDIFKLWEKTDTEMTPVEAFYRFNALKYLWRCYKKNGIEDLEKCADYVRLLTEELKKNKG